MPEFKTGFTGKQVFLRQVFSGKKILEYEFFVADSSENSNTGNVYVALIMSDNSSIKHRDIIRITNSIDMLARVNNGKVDINDVGEKLPVRPWTYVDAQQSGFGKDAYIRTYQF